MLTLLVLQLVVPLLMLAWLTFAPPRSRAGYWLQALATGLVFLAIAYVGIWTFPPWWTPYVYASLLLAVVIHGAMTRRDTALWPRKLTGWSYSIVFVALGVYAADTATDAIAATSRPSGRVVDLSSPLGPGTYLVANGGSAVSVNAHAAFLDEAVPTRRKYRGTGRGVDLVALDRWGLRAAGVIPANPRQYFIFGKPVVAPCSGNVIAAIDGLPDMAVPQTDHDHLAGNHVILRCVRADILLGHFQSGSVQVHAGLKLKQGDRIARVGNSGNTSEPHLHIHAQESGTADAPFSGAPIPIRINGRYLARNDRLVVRERRRQP